MAASNFQSGVSAGKGKTVVNDRRSEKSLAWVEKKHYNKEKKNAVKTNITKALEEFKDSTISEIMRKRVNFVVLDADIFAQECILKSKFFRTLLA